jgi:hypothetical protein
MSNGPDAPGSVVVALCTKVIPPTAVDQVVLLVLEVSVVFCR